MTLTDWIGTAGVSILLLAFLFNLSKKISQESIIYITMNLAGAMLACLASVLLNYWPFIILEAVWMVISAGALFKILRRK